MKKALVYHRTLATIGGGKFVLINVIKVLRKKGFSTTLATHDDVREMPNLWQKITKFFNEKINPDNFCTIPKIVNHTSLSKIRFLRKIPYLIDILKRNRFIKLCGKLYDIIVDVYGDMTLPSDISYIHDPPPDIRMKFLPPHHLAYKLLYRNIVLKASHRKLIVTNSKYTSRKILYNTRFLSEVVNPPVSIRKYFDVFDKKDRLNLIINVSRIEHRKNLLIIPEVMKNIKNAKFILIGFKTNETNSVLKLLSRKKRELKVADRLRIIIDASPEEKKEWLAKGKIYFHTMPNESFGISIIEGMASGLVPVVPRSGGPWTDILTQRNGIYGYAYHNIKEATYYLNTILNRDKVRERIRRRIKSYIWRFDERVFLESMSKIINKALKLTRE